jgi:hypothetical protein
MRLAIVVFGLHMALFPFTAHISSVSGFFFLLVYCISTSLFWGGVVFVLYLALEPYVRRYWPQAIISWTRALTGRWRDPLVGRDVLYGVVAGLTISDLYGLRFYLATLLGASPIPLNTDYLHSARYAIGAWLTRVPESVSSALLMFLVLFLCRVALRKSWLAAAAFVVLWTAMKAITSDYPVLDWPIQSLIYITIAVAALRYGLVPLAVAIFTANVMLNIPTTLNPSAWYFSNTTVALLLPAALAIWGFYTALAGQTPWKEAHAGAESR